MEFLKRNFFLQNNLLKNEVKTIFVSIIIKKTEFLSEDQPQNKQQPSHKILHFSIFILRVHIILE